MGNTAIRAINLGKKYQIGAEQTQYKYVRDLLAYAAKAPFRRARMLLSGQASGAADLNAAIWALKDVSFDVTHGEVVGVIGRNGAGKSTLLKILSRITEPTAGYAEVFGRVGSLLEVGTGFHPELTGRENVYLNGTILGMSREEISRKFDEIVAFSGIEKFIDTPVKHYSSGMHVRLAFSVAAHLEPEILLVDEVLAVGDIGFQKKCLGKMGKVAGEGRTVLFVSHNMGAIQSLCERCMLIVDGNLAMDGPVSGVVGTYVDMFFSDNESLSGERSWQDNNAPGIEPFRLRRIRLLDAAGICQSNFDTTKPIKVEITFELQQGIRGMRLFLQVRTQEDIVAFSTTNHRELTQELLSGVYRSVCIIPGTLLNEGIYAISVHAGIPGVRKLTREPVKMQFRTTASSGYGGGVSFFPEKWPGVVAPKLDWFTERIEVS